MSFIDRILGNKSKAKETLTEEQSNEILQQAIEEKITQESFVASSESVEMPTQGGRSSQPEFGNTFLPNKLSPIEVQYPFHLLRILENLSIYDRHVSYAVENISSLGNTNYDVEFEEGTSDDQIVEMKKHLNSVCGSWYEFSDGANGLINDLFAQVATFGCISAERVIREDLTGIKKIVRVNPIYIKFTYDKETEEYTPLQEAQAFQSYSSLSLGYVELNLSTYSYIALKRFKSSPYAVAPFFSAIEDLCTEADMMANFKNMMKRLGMLGFLSVLVKAPRNIEGESPEEYRKRVDGYLDTVRPEAEKAFSKGVVVGYQGNHEFNVSGNNMNVEGADKLMKIIKSLVFNGLKQDPNMLGENFSVTETFGKVILEKMSKQICNYQKTVGSFLEQCFLQELVLAGFNPGSVKVKFDKPTITDQQHYEDARNMKFDRLKKEYDQGLIDQQQFAQSMGYDEASEIEPRLQKNTNPPVEKQKEKKDKKKEDKAENIKKLGINLRKDLPVYSYEIPAIEDEGLANESFDVTTNFDDKFMTNAVSKYVSKVNNQYTKAVDKAGSELKRKSESWDQTLTLTQLKEDVMVALMTNWEQNFANPVSKTARKNVESIYDHYRKDKSVFTDRDKLSKTVKSSFVDIPASTYDLLDFRTIDYLAEVDGVYLGKFITDPDTVKRVNKWIEQSFESGNVPVGKDSPAINDFIEEFDDTVNLERWKIRRIIETTANKARAFANVNYVKQAGVEKYEIVEMLDNRTCEYCKHMNGKIMQVELAVDQIQKATDQGIEEMTKIMPFVTALKIGEFRKLDTAELQLQGFNTPSFHPHCRGRIVAVL